MTQIVNFQTVVDKIIESRSQIPANRSALCAISGIDASSKGYLTTKIAKMLQPAGLSIANINIDGWQNLPHIRFREANPAQHFYLNAIRFDEMSNRLIFPLRDRGSLCIEIDIARKLPLNIAGKPTSSRTSTSSCWKESIY